MENGFTKNELIIAIVNVQWLVPTEKLNAELLCTLASRVV